MVVKDKKGRHRYILFAVNTKKEEVIKKIKKAPIKIKLAFYNGEYGIIKCSHIEKQEAINFLNNYCKFKTIKTSGTIKKLKKLIAFSESKPRCSFFLACCAFLIAFFLW